MASTRQSDTTGDAVLNADVPGLIRLFTKWRHTPPDTQKTALKIAERLDGFSPDSLRLIQTAASLAGEKNDNAYHNNEHFLEVFTLSATLGHRAVREGIITNRNFARLLAAALIHDFRHNGTPNKDIQYKQESLAYREAAPAFLAAGATSQDMKVIQGLLYATDISKNFSDPAAMSPADSVKAYKRTGDPAILFPELKVLKNPELMETALMLQDADVGPSLIDKNLSLQASEFLAKENNQPYKPDATVFFINRICQGRLNSSAGGEIIQPFTNRMIGQLKRDQRFSGLSPS